MQGIGLVIAFVIAIILMILAISKLKIHPFLSIMGVLTLLGLLAGVGVGIFTGEVEAADKCVRIETDLKPNMENHQKYQSYFKVYQHIVDNLAPVYSELYKIQKN